MKNSHCSVKLYYQSYSALRESDVERESCAQICPVCSYLVETVSQMDGSHKEELVKGHCPGCEFGPCAGTKI